VYCSLDSRLRPWHRHEALALPELFDLPRALLRRPATAFGPWLSQSPSAQATARPRSTGDFTQVSM